MLERPMNLDYNRSAAMAINSHPKYREYTENQKKVLINKLHNEMVDCKKWINNPETYARNLLDKYATQPYTKGNTWSDEGYFERDGAKADGIIKPRVPVDDMIHPDFRGPACYRYENMMPEIRARKAEIEERRKKGLNIFPHADDGKSPLKGLELKEMLQVMVDMNREASKSLEHQAYMRGTLKEAYTKR